jgi:hypothetical protein
MGRKQDILCGGTAIDRPVSGIVLHIFIVTNQYARIRTRQHGGIGVKFHNALFGLRITEHKKMPGLLVYCGGSIHGGFQQKFNLFVGYPFTRIFPDASAGKDGFHCVHIGSVDKYS